MPVRPPMDHGPGSSTREIDPDEAGLGLSPQMRVSRVDLRTNQDFPGVRKKPAAFPRRARADRCRCVGGGCDDRPAG